MSCMENLKESHIQQKLGRSLILFPLPFQGHINPMLQLANILYSKGFSIIIIHTQLNPPNPENYPHFTFYSIPNSGLENEATRANLIHYLPLMNTKCVKPFTDILSKLLLELKDQEPICCLITAGMWQFAEAVADSIKLPRIVMRISNITSFLFFASLPLLQEKGYYTIKDSQPDETIKETPPLTVKDLTQYPEQLQSLLAGLVNGSKTSSGLIWNSFEELEKDSGAKFCQDFSIPIFPIGPFHKYMPASSSSLLTQDRTCISWLDAQAPNSVLYVSFGSVVSIKKNEFLEIAWGLANSNQPFLLVVRPGLVQGSDCREALPNGFLEMVGQRGYLVKWAPQQEVLAHHATGGFWTHNGWNSTLEAICEGVPMICQPSFGEQKVNARNVSDVWKIGMHMEYELERAKIERTIKRLMVETEGQEIRKRSMSLKEKTNVCVKPGGSSHRSLTSLVDHILSL